jgi:hypothetical protein
MNLFFYNFSKKIIKENSKFIFRIDFKAPLNLKKKMNFRVKSLKSLRLFYINIKYKQFQKLGKKIIRMDGTFEHNYLYFLECRLVNLVYRSGFLFNMFDCINFVNQGHIFVNKKSKIFQNDIVSIMEFVGFRPLIKGTIY